MSERLALILVIMGFVIYFGWSKIQDLFDGDMTFDQVSTEQQVSPRNKKPTGLLTVRPVEENDLRGPSSESSQEGISESDTIYPTGPHLSNKPSSSHRTPASQK